MMLLLLLSESSQFVLGRVGFGFELLHIEFVDDLIGRQRCSTGAIAFDGLQ